MDALKFRLVQYDKLYGGEKQVDASECLMMMIKLIKKGSVINKGSVPYCGSNDIMIIIRQGFLYLKSYFYLCQKNILCAIHVD